jgi:hypothetical protein
MRVMDQFISFLKPNKNLRSEVMKDPPHSSTKQPPTAAGILKIMET